MVEVKEVLRLWLSGAAKKTIARQLGMDPKTVRSYVAAGEAAGLVRGDGATVTDELLTKTLTELRPSGGRPHGDAWALCEQEKDELTRLLAQRVRLSKVRRLLQRRGIDLPYSTLHRFAVEVLGFGRAAPTVPVADGKPGEELEVDTGWVLWLTGEGGQRKRVRAWVFTPSVSRYRFVWPVFEETTVSAIGACEAAWEFYGGVFRVLRPDNTKAVVCTPDPLNPRLTEAFLEYAQARGFHVDPARVRSPKDKARVERSVRDVRDDCFGGEVLRTLEQARDRAQRWCANEYGQRRHSTTRRMPKEHFEADEKSALLPAPTTAYDVPLWCDPKVPRDHLAQVAGALYSLPTRLIGKTLRARADRSLVRFYDGEELVKTHARQPSGTRSIDAADFPAEKMGYALRDVAHLARSAKEHGENVGRFADALLAGPLPWTRMRRVYALLGLAKRYGDNRLDTTCHIALQAGMHDVRRLERMLKNAAPAPQPTIAVVIPIARFLRPASQYALPLASSARESTEGEDQ